MTTTTTAPERSQSLSVDKPGPSAGRPPTGSARVTTSTVLLYVALLLLSVIFLAPLLWMIVTSFKTDGGATATPPQWVPDPVSFEGYQTLFADAQARCCAGWPTASGSPCCTPRWC